MIASERRILQSIRGAAAAFAAGGANPEHQALLGAIDVALNELLLRRDTDFYRDHYRRGLALAEEGVRKLGLGGDAAAAKLAALPQALDRDASGDAIGRRTTELSACLEALTEAAGAPREGIRKDYLVRITDWEVSLYQHQLETRDSPRAETAQVTRERLQAYLRGRFPERKDLEVTGFQPLSGGFSKATILFSTKDRVNGSQELVLRAEQQADIIRLDGGSLDNEYRVLRIAYEAGIRVPEPLWLEEDTSALGTRFVVSRKAAGKIYGTVASAAESLSTELLRSVVGELAKIHTLRLDPQSEWVAGSHLPNWLRFATVTENLRRHVEYWWDPLESTCRHASLSIL